MVSEQAAPGDEGGATSNFRLYHRRHGPLLCPLPLRRHRLNFLRHLRRRPLKNRFNFFRSSSFNF